MSRLNIVDNRTPATLIEDGDDRWPGGDDYCPPHLTGQAKESFLADLRQLRADNQEHPADGR